VRIAVPSKRYFASPFDVDNKCARDAGQVLAGTARHFKLPVRTNKRTDRFFLSLS
jgi:hypothetical protein